jgi:ATP-dependent Lhr-like helicase
MRFLLRWHHVAPGTQLTGEHGLLAALDQLQGWEAGAVAWEPELLAKRMRTYRAELLDQLCHAGQLVWLRLTPRPRDDADAPVGQPSKATPISVVFRADLSWLLAAARGGQEPPEPSVGATAEILQALRERGASFASELEVATRRMPEDVERGLWDGVARGLLTADGFGAIRTKMHGTSRPNERRRFSRLLRGAPAAPSAAGRWTLVSATGAEQDAADLDPDDLAEAVAELLLRRWGVIFRDLAVHDSLRLPWREIQWALRRLEDRGLVRGGRFVTGFTGEQYALPEAEEQLLHVAKVERSGERVTVNATDPLNLVNVIVPGTTVPAVRTNTVTFVDGVPEG